jgi:DNA-binding transcriptional regulator YiaG
MVTRHASSALAEVRRLCASGEARAIRQAADVSLAEVASDIPTSATTVLRWEQRAPRGRLALRYLAVLRRLQNVNTSGDAA